MRESIARVNGEQWRRELDIPAIPCPFRPIYRGWLSLASPLRRLSCCEQLKRGLAYCG